MKPALFPLMRIGILAFGYLYATSEITNAQVTPDGTVNTQVNQTDNVSEITGGETRGNNLFHSFQEFSVGAGNEAFFNNADNISNIFSRVTGGNVSNIDGLIRANGSASLFLINPAGIIFGEGARLDIGGSFYGSSASGILFEDGEFSAVDLENPPVLTVNAPIGLNLRDEPGDIIVNRSFAQNSAEEFVGLEVLPGNNLAFIGGNINFEAGEATASGGNIELGGLSEAGIVSINEDGSLSFPEDVTKADITLSNGADVDVMGTGGGSVTVNARNLTLTPGEFGSSLITAGIRPESTSAEAQAGDVSINVTDKITLDGSRILNQVNTGGVGNSGKITINTGSLEAINGGDVDASTLGQGDAGAVNITATGDLTFDGEDSEGDQSGATSLVGTDAVGNAGGVTISTNNLTLTNGGRVDASTYGQRNGGAVNITATGDLTFDGEDSEGIPSGAISRVGTDAVGNAGGVTISTNNLTLTNGGRVDASISGQGDAGAVNITATGDLTFDGKTSEGFASGAASRVGLGAEGDAGGVTISTNNLTLTNGGRVDASTLGQGDAGAVNITATGDLTFDGEDSEGFASGAASLVNSGAVGDAGGVTISTNNLNLTNGGRVNASTYGQGNAGAVNITATESIFINGFIPRFRSGISANALNEDGNGGNVFVRTGQLTIENGGTIEATNFDNIGNDDLPGTGKPGNIFIDANNIDLGDKARIEAATQSATGESGKIDLQVAEDITLQENSFISAQAFNNANGGNLNIDARFIIAYPGNGVGNDLVATADAGKGGNINLNVEQLFGLQPGDAIERNNNFIINDTNNVDASSNIEGLGGNITINTSGVNPVQGTTELPANTVELGETRQQACQANRDGTAKNGLTIKGKGGVPPAPDLPLNSQSISINGEIDPTISTIPEPIETSLGKIQPARGIKVTKDGRVTLTAYRTNNAGERIPEIKPNCNNGVSMSN
jgi:filamentous hemagglutinin family protein